jgi:putative endonuclease
MDYIVYILFSVTKNRYYIGFTSDLEQRVLRHNQISKGFTGNVNHWEVVYNESFSSKAEAVKRELQIKSWKSRLKIVELINAQK